MDKKFLTDIKNIRRAIDTKKLVVFAGAGISFDAGVPRWRELIEEIKIEIDLPKYETDYLRIAQMYYNERQEKEYVEKIRKVLKHKKTSYNEIHEGIFRLKPEHILTTNYDDLLEQVIKKQSLPFSVVTKDGEFPFTSNTNLLVKIHGDLNESDFVLKEDDYLDYSLNHPLIEGFIKSVFASKIVLFIGYSFSDMNLKMIIQNVRNILGKNFQNAYLLSVEENLHPTQRDYFKNKGINVVNYFDADSFIIKYLKGENALKGVYFKKGIKLSKEGQNLSNILEFINRYDEFNESLLGKNIIDQMYLSLERFSELTTLPQNFVAKLYPFNPTKKIPHNLKGTSLLTINKDIEDLFFNEFQYENGEITLAPSSTLNFTLQEVSDYRHKLKEIIKRLNFSLIFSVVKENQVPDSLGSKGWSNDYKGIFEKSLEICECSNCKLERFELNKVVEDLYNTNVNETSEIKSDLQEAYTHYKLGRFKQSFNLFEEIATKAWQRGKYFSYYIAKHNLKNLRNLIKFREDKLKEEDKERILKTIEDIDFDKLLFQIPYMGELEYELLKIIRDDDVLLKAEEAIDKTLFDIISMYDLHEQGGWAATPNYPFIVQIELYKIYYFYSHNFIIVDEFSNFTSICDKGIEALLISYATNEKYAYKLKEFDKMFFDFVVFYGNSTRIKKVLEKYNIVKLKFSNESVEEILKSVNNYLRSFFINSNLFKNTSKNEIISSHLNNHFFEDKCRKSFKNMFLVLSMVKLRKEDDKPLIDNLIEFLKYEPFVWGDSIKYLSDFLYANEHLLSQSTILNLLKAASRKIITYPHGKFLEAIAAIFKKRNFNGISDKDLILNLLHQVQSFDEDSTMITKLWAMSDTALKAELKERIIARLETKFDSQLYLDASYDKIIDYNNYFELYISEVDKQKGSQIEIHNSKPVINNYTFINAIAFIYFKHIDSSDQRLLKFTNLSDYMLFFLYPEKFDYNNFKVEWLLILKADVIYQKLKTIPIIKEKIEEYFKKNTNAELSEIYVKYFI